MQSDTLQLGYHYTVSCLSLFPVVLLDFSEQILHTLIGCAYLPVGGMLSAKYLPKSLLLDAACETFWASVALFLAKPSPTIISHIFILGLTVQYMHLHLPWQM